MGLFSFIKDAGAKVFGIGKTRAEEAADKAADAAEAKLNSEKAAANNLMETVNDLQLDVKNLNIHILDDKATITGAAYDQATKEKVV